jgi:hypothetical protein
MNWQLIAVGIIVALTAIYLARQTWRTWSAKKAGCGGSCGCSGKTGTPAEVNGHGTLIAPSEITLRRRGGAQRS